MNDGAILSKPPVWHAGETALQASIGAADKMAALGERVIRDHMPDQHRDFFAQVPFVVAGSVDRLGDAWATLLEGRPGFIASPGPTTLRIAAAPAPDDPAGEGMREGDALGLLGVELHTRRRNRANGHIRASEDGALAFEVEESFGNCPKYILLRDFAFARDPALPAAGEVVTAGRLDGDARAMIERADTFFVASYADEDGRRRVDVSHRGGKPGFVRVAADGTLVIPDFSGNRFFSTLGNILLNGKAGLVFADFETGDLLQMSGDAEVLLDSPEIAAFQGAERFWTFRPRRLVTRRAALALRWTLRADGWSPFALMTGDWDEAAGRLIRNAAP